MIKKERYSAKEGGGQLFHTFSDTGHQIRSKRTGIIYDNAVDVTEDDEYEEVEDYIALEGPSTYEDVLKESENAELITRKINRIGLTDNEALSVKEMYPRWEDKVGSTIEAGFITLYKGNLWKARQTHTALEVYPPSMATASLYEVVVYQHKGTEDDPIPYIPPMEIYEGKYYTENGFKYLCIRSGGIALSHELSTLIGIYVELV
jgi:hypothetical protein